MYNIIKIDPYLKPYESDIELRMANYKAKKDEILSGSSLLSFADAYKYFGINKTKTGWVYREWAPAADKMYFTGDFCDWDLFRYEMARLDGGVFEIELPDTVVKEGQNVEAIVLKDGNALHRVPSFATRVVQDESTKLWCAQIENTQKRYNWTDKDFVPEKTPLIYECHIGMAEEKYGVGTYEEFRLNVLPRIKSLGYNTIQIMAIMEHPYYGSFGYQVSNFFAPSSRYGKSEDLKKLIDTAHSMGIAVLLDVVHSHAVMNTGEGLNMFDGTDYQYFHSGGRGNHPAWGTRLFDYTKPEVLRFLLSNLKYWLKVFHFDGFRFDGVTSMIYNDHGLGSAFTDYSMYFSMNTDTESVTYLQLANELIHKVNKNAITIAEDMSGMPGMCLPIKDGGIGFDYRLSMGMPDLWIKLLKEYSDENWDIGKIWFELTSRRPMEKNIGYCESHDQALVGDKTIMFRLCDAEMYTGMRKFGNNATVDRGIALHKMIRLLTASLAGEGYLNFMGNEFGHPEWIDFPREGNGWSYHYCRRQWHLVDDSSLRYCELNNFDKAMLVLLKNYDVLSKPSVNRWMHQDDKVIIYSKDDLIFVFNFHTTKSFEGYFVPTGESGKYKIALSSDDGIFGGLDRISHETDYSTEELNGMTGFKSYLPCRTAAVYKKI